MTKTCDFFKLIEKNFVLSMYCPRGLTIPWQPGQALSRFEVFLVQWCCDITSHDHNYPVTNAKINYFGDFICHTCWSSTWMPSLLELIVKIILSSTIQVITVPQIKSLSQRWVEPPGAIAEMCLESLGEIGQLCEDHLRIIMESGGTTQNMLLPIWVINQWIVSNRL